MNEIPDLILQAAARRGFWAFCIHWDRDFFERRPFLYMIADAFQRIADGEIKSLAVSMPPRAGKSYITSLYCAWLIGRDPSGSVLRNSTTARLYNKFSYDVRSFIRDPKYTAIFPNVRLSQDKQSLEGWNVTKAKQVTYYGAGVGGTIIGFGATLAAITDDLYRGHEDAMSETINSKIARWYESQHLSRIEKHCPQVDIGTRWSETDVIGQNTKDGHYDEIIKVPALINGASFCEDVKTTAEYKALQARTDPFIWNSEYMQEPIQLEGTVFPKDRIQYYDELPRLAENETPVYVYFGDTADEGEDYYSGPYAMIKDNLVYIIDATFNRFNLTENEPILLALLQNYSFARVWIESNSFGAYYVRNIRKQTEAPVRGLKSTKNKMLRILAESGFILQNFRFPSNSPSNEYDRFFIQVCNLLKTGSKHDDAPDSLAGMSFMVRRDFMRS
jgi:predicted phage terminase large subunit-like protein